MPAHTHIFLRFSVSNTSQLCNGAPDPLELSSQESRFATAMAPSFCSSSVMSSSSQKKTPSEFDLPGATRLQHFPIPPIGPQSLSTPTPSSSLTSTTSEGSRASTIRLRILHPQKKLSESGHCANPSPALQNTTESSIESLDSGYKLFCLGWRGVKKPRSKRRRACTQLEAESDSSQKRQQSAIRRCSSWCSTNGDAVQKGSSSSANVESSCITEVSNSNGCSNIKSDPVSVDTVSWNGRSSAGMELTTKLDQLALVACELKAKRTRSPRNQIRRHYYTTSTFSPLSLITSYWQQNSISSIQEVSKVPHKASLDMRRSVKAAQPAIYNKDRSDDSADNLKIKKAKNSGRQTRVQRCARQVLELVGKDTIREKLIRQALGNNPDTSKALRLLLDQRKLGRIGGGGRKDPYKYKVTPYGLLELSEKKDASSLLEVSGAGFVENTWNAQQLSMKDFYMTA